MQVNIDKIHISAFEGNISEVVLSNLPFKHKYIIKSNAKSIIDFAKLISSLPKDSIIVGLGKSDKREIRVESVCTNQFRNKILTEIKKMKISEFINCKKFESIGTSYCNLISYEIATRINPDNYAFIHIPEKYNALMAKEEIEDILVNSVKIEP